MNDTEGIATGAQLSIKLRIEDPPEGDLTELYFANKSVVVVDDSIQRINSPSRRVETLSSRAEVSVNVGTAVVGGYDTAKAVGSSIPPLASALRSMEQIVKIVDGIAEVTHFPPA
jgi:hypothetical protein